MHAFTFRTVFEQDRSFICPLLSFVGARGNSIDVSFLNLINVYRRFMFTRGGIFSSVIKPEEGFFSISIVYFSLNLNPRRVNFF